METCKACGAPLTVLIQHEDSEEHDGYLPDASSSASKQGVLVDDDVELQCGCHFHWCVDTSNLSLPIVNQLIDMVRGGIQVMPLRIIHHHRMPTLWERSYYCNRTRVSLSAGFMQHQE